MSMIKEIELKLFPYDILYCQGVKVEAIEKELEKYKITLTQKEKKYLNKSGVGHTLRIKDYQTVIYIPGKKPTSGLIAHEVFHAIWMILATMGVEPSVESEEVYAYMLEHIINEISNLNNNK